MKKLTIPLFVIILLMVLLILFVVYNRYSGYYQEQQTLKYIERNVEILNENLEFEKRYALSLSLYVSKNKAIQKALITSNQKQALNEMHAFLEEIKVATGISNIDVQIHTKTLKALARNWDNSKYLGTQLGGFRKGLVQVKKTKLPLVSIELGKRLNIKASPPYWTITKTS